jgi:hypothetical protein
MSTGGGTSGDIAVGVPVFQRTGALELLLESVPAYVSSVYVADNGHRDERADLYDREWPFELEVLRPGFDVGIGACRAALTDAATEPYLWMGDCDMAFQRDSDLRDLRRILAARPDLGGVSGWLLEGDTVRSGARDLVEANGRLYKEFAGERDINSDPLPHAEAEMIPQSGLFRTAVFDDYGYDPAAGSTEHVDFFVGHKRAAKWRFASTPAVVITHHRNIDPEYRENRGQSHVEESYLADKWGIEAIHHGRRSDWVTTDERPLHEDCFDVVRRVTPRRVWTPLYRGVKTLL